MISKVIKVEGLNIYYRVGGDVSKSTILWLDGLSISKDLGGRMEKTGRLLSHFFKDFYVVSLEYPSFMRSDIPAREWSIDDYVELIHKFISLVRLKTPLVLMAHSFGAKLAYAYSAKYPKNIKLLVISAPPVTSVYSQGRLKTVNLIERLASPFFNSRFVPDSLKKLVPKFFMSTSSENLKRYSVKEIKVGVFSLIHIAKMDVIDLSERVVSKTILISGKKDFFVDPKNLDTLRSRIKDCTYYSFNEGHTTLPWELVKLKPEIVKLIK